MQTLAREYIQHNKRLAFAGFLLGSAWAVLTFWHPNAFLVNLGMVALSFPFTPKSPRERLLHTTLASSLAALALACCGKWCLPLGLLGVVGSAVFCPFVLCLRYGKQPIATDLTLL